MSCISTHRSSTTQRLQHSLITNTESLQILTIFTADKSVSCLCLTPACRAPPALPPQDAGLRVQGGGHLCRGRDPQEPMPGVSLQEVPRRQHEEGRLVSHSLVVTTRCLLCLGPSV